MRSPWLAYEAMLANWMQQFANHNLKFTNGYQAIPGFPSDGFRADGLLTDGSTLIALEVEVKQTHPDSNVGKYWILEQYKKYQKIILFHVYTPEFNSYPWRLRLGEFYASKMSKELPFEYVLLDQRKDVDMDNSFNFVTNTMQQRIEQEFKEKLTLLSDQVIA